MSFYTAQLFCRWSSYLWNKMIFPPPALLSEFSYRPTFYFNAGISARTSSATRFAAGPSSGQKAVSCAGVLQLLQMFLLLFHCPGHERVGALTALELRAGEYRAKNPEKYTIHSLIFLFVCLTFVSSQRRLTLWELTNLSPESQSSHNSFRRLRKHRHFSS